MPPPTQTLSFGHAALAQRIVAELTASLQPGAGSSTEPALVVGVFGEWGAGKSRLLQTVADALPRGETEQSLTVVVPFNAWRYEREEHLLVPLLRVAQQCLRKALEESLGADIHRNEKLSDRLVLLGDLAQTVYQHGGRELLQTALATQGVVLKLPELKAEAGKAPPSAWARWRQRRDALQQARRLALPADALHSLYYDFLEHLKAVTGRNPKALALHRERLKYRGLGWWPRLKWRVRAWSGWVGTGELPPDADFQLNFVFLVDDLDRCLPDKAVEVLEAIKLFLEVEGCAFVLALDEEVIERGIAHRYRDYALQGREGLTPITGAEYLEKLVHLPVRLPRPTRAEAESFLAQRHAALFTSDGAPNDLARLVSAITPPVPRKLHRMIDLLEMADQLAIPAGQGAARRQWLAIACALQLFSPALYRFVRMRGATLLLTLAEWRTQGRLRDLDALRAQLARDVRKVKSAAQLNYALVLQRLPDLCAAALQNRSGFDLLELLAQVGDLHAATPPSAVELGALLAFTEMKAEPQPALEHIAPQALPNHAPQEAADAGATDTPPAAAPPAPLERPMPAPASRERPAASAASEVRLEDERGLLDALVSGDAELVRFALSREGEALQGRSLPAAFWNALFDSAWRQRLKEWMDEGMPPGATEQTLRELKPHLSQAMALQLLQTFGAPLHTVLRQPSWASRVRFDKGDPYAPSLRAPPLDVDLPTSLSTRDHASAASWQVPRGWQSPTDEVWSGNVGDCRVTLKLGSDARFGVFALVTLQREGATRPVTQRLRWMEPGSFIAGSPVDELGRSRDERPATATHLHVGYWIADTPCTFALWWAVMLERMPSEPDDLAHMPVTGVLPDDVFEFLRRLGTLVPACAASLPDEREWEYACRAGTSTPWAFGQRVDASQVRMQSGGTAPVASLPPNAWGLHEMHGNVAEMCSDASPYDSVADPGGKRPDRIALRGGSFADPPDATRSAAGRMVAWSFRAFDAGFRFKLQARDRPPASGPEAAGPAT